MEGKNKMLKICICDDERFQGTEFEDYIIDYMDVREIKLEIDIFESGTALVKQIQREKELYQIAFLDIEMEGMNGIETAKCIRQMDKDLVIVYVTSYEKYTLESFEVSPFRYLIKPVKKEQFQMVLDQAVNEIMMRNQYLFFKVQGKQYQVKYDNIISIMSEKGRIIHVHTNDTEEGVSFYGKIKDLEKILNPYMFIKINQGTIVNFNYIYIISNSEIRLVTNEILPISRGQKSRVKKGYNDFLKRKMGV